MTPGENTLVASKPRFENLMTPATWMVVSAGLFLLLYSVYINQFTGSKVKDFKTGAFSGHTPFTQAATLFGGEAITHTGDAIQLDPQMMPAKFQIRVTTPSRGQLEYQLILVDERGSEVWRETGTQYWDRSSSTDTVERRRTLGLSPFSLEQSGQYTLLARLEGGYDHEITLRRNVTEASMIVYAIASLILITGLLLLIRNRRGVSKAS
jgi:hypothetical protein